MSTTASMEPTTAISATPAEGPKEKDSSAPSSPPSSPVDKASPEPDTTAPAAPEEPEAETPKMPHDSMVTVRLSEPPNLTLDTTVADDGDLVQTTEPQLPENRVSKADTEVSAASSPEKRASTASTIAADANRNLQDELAEEEADNKSQSSDDQEEVDWAKLEQTEDEQTKDDETDNSTTLLLQRLEQENAKLATNPKTVKVRVAEEAAASNARPPSMAQLRQMVNGPTPSALRYSMLPPPPMTDLEFWAALVKDYQQTAARLPTLLSNKIHKGIPPPLRGVVWQSMSGARDAVLEEQYERFCGETSPYEPLIGKDLGRSFPGVDMFRDADGDGQRMLGRVLKCFSLYDTKIGYCQGLAFLVGPLLMHMPDKQAFCVLVRLMERYDLRTCFLPDLSGLHVRIYQFRELLRSNLPTLSTHFEELQVDPAYVSQWFLSFFAVTCPLPMLFRIYDVIFAEGASETLMRVALSLMRKNESRLLACSELEDVMQLLLSRGLWDCYHYDTEEFVDDFVSLTSEVSRENLTQLEQGYRESLIAAANVTRSSDITTAASRFLGRIWASSTISPKPASTLSPTSASAPSRPVSMLRRSASKQSLASTLNSMEASSVSVTSSTSTDASTVSRDSQGEEESSSRESTPVGTKSIASTKTVEDKYLHSQIEDLLTALSELQRDHAVVTNQLQREKEEREEDQKAVQPLLEALRRGTTPVPTAAGEESGTDGATEDVKTAEATSDGQTKDDVEQPADVSPDMSELIEKAQERFSPDHKSRRSSIMQSKAQMREELVHVKDQLANSMSQSQDYNRRLRDLDQEVGTLKDQLRESHAHVRMLNQDKHRLESQARTRPGTSAGPDEQDANLNIKGAPSGLRELKLARSNSSPSQGGFNKRLSSLPARTGSAISMTSLATPATPASPNKELTVPPANEQEALLIELAQCKTAEAVARQEAEEAKQKLEAFRKAYGMAPGDTPPPVQTPGTAAMTAMDLFGRLTGQATTPAATETPSKHVATPSAASTGGGFWGWRR